MRKILLALALTFLLGKAMSQGIYQPVTPTAYGSNNLRGVFRTALLIPSGCGVPGAMSLYSVDSSRFALYGDTCANKLYFYNPRTRQWLLSGQTSIPWDSVSGKPVNFPTTYALSNDVQDSIQNRVPYENATRSVNLGNYRLSARGLLMDSLWARNSGGTVAVTNSGTKSFSWGAGGSSEATFYGFAGMDYNRSGSMTSTSFTPKVYVDSLAALRLLKSDSLSGGYTTWLLTKKKIDSIGSVLSNGYVTIATDQDVTGRKSFTQGRIWFGSNQSGQSIVGNSNGISFGNSNSLGGTSNIVLGFESYGNGNQGISIGFNANSGSSGATDNIAIGQKATEYISTGSSNIAIGTFSANGLSTGSGNIAIGSSAGSYIVGSLFQLQTNTNSVFIGNGTRGSANGNTNEIVIGEAALGNGSNTVTIGNSSVTDNYFSGNIRGGAFIKSGGTSSQFLKADGSVDGTSYATAASLSGYVDLTNNQTVGGVKTFTSSTIMLSSTTSTAGLTVRGGSSIGTPTSASGQILIGATATYRGSIAYEDNLGYLYIDNLYDNANSNIYIRTRTNGTPINALTFVGSGAATFANSINGTSLYMSGGAAFATSSGDVLIAGATTDGTNKLIVNGGVKGGTFTATNVNNSTVFSAASATTGWVQIGMNNTSGSAMLGVESNTAGTLAVGSTSYATVLRNYTNTDLQLATNNIVRLTLSSTGAATFSSSVTATQGRIRANLVNSTTYGQLDVQAAGEAAINILGTAYSSIYFGDAANHLEGAIVYDHSTNTLELRGSGNTTDFSIAPTGAATFSSSVTASSFIRSGGTSTQALMADGSVQTVTSGTYNPTLTGTTNISSITLDRASFIRVCNLVTVTVYGTVQTTASGASDFTISLPFTAGSTAPMSGSGTVANLGIDSRAMFGQSSSTTTIKYYWDSPNTTLKPFSVTFQFEL